MRKISSDIIGEENPEVYALDEAGPGGASHSYRIVFSNGLYVNLHFQKGPINEVGRNGITNEVLLAIVMDRLRGFNSGPFACTENDAARENIEVALQTLKQRTRERIARGVEGKSVA